uniref:Carboxypeptidase A1 n=1 Tax=Melopsittacus undulatus TaxID=13146 RepID=A0A8V5GDV2_MELUD
MQKVHELQDVEELQLDFWLAPRVPGHPVDIRVPLHSLQPLKEHLESNDISYSVMIKDVQVSHKIWGILGVKPPHPGVALCSMCSRRAGCDPPIVLLQIYAFMDLLVAENPNLVSKIQIGRSTENRPLYVLRVRAWGPWGDQRGKWGQGQSQPPLFVLPVQQGGHKPPGHLD